jgi:hypothetical protein
LLFPGEEVGVVLWIFMEIIDPIFHPFEVVVGSRRRRRRKTWRLFVFVVVVVGRSRRRRR